LTAQFVKLQCRFRKEVPMAKKAAKKTTKKAAKKTTKKSKK
jgi:hypothetical protein